MIKVVTILISLALCACGSIDAQLISTSPDPAPKLHFNSFYERQGCSNIETSHGRIEGGQIEWPRTLPVKEANAWVQTHSSKSGFPLINQAFSFGCGDRIDQVPFARSERLIDGAIEVWLYSDAGEAVQVDIRAILLQLQPRFDTGLRRLEQDRLRIILAAICTRPADERSFAFRGVFDRDIPTTRAVAFIPCLKGPSEPAEHQVLRREITKALAIAMHEAMHGVTELRVAPQRDAPFVQLADELIATMVGAEFYAEAHMLLAVAPAISADPAPCDFNRRNMALVEPFAVDDDLLLAGENRNSPWVNRIGPEFGALFGRVVHSLTTGTETGDRRAISRALTPAAATELLDTYGTDLSMWTALIQETLGCPR